MGALLELARKHHRIFDEPLDDGCDLAAEILAMESGRKPAVLAENTYEYGPTGGDYGLFIEEVRDFTLGASNLGWHVEVAVRTPWHLTYCVSRFRSVARTLRTLNEADMTDWNAAAVGVLLGYPLAEVEAYCERTARWELLDAGWLDEAEARQAANPGKVMTKDGRARTRRRG